MTPRIATISEKKLMGKKMMMSFEKNRTGELWGSFMPLRKEIRNNIGSDLYSLQSYPPSFFEAYDPSRDFEKWAAMEVRDLNELPAGMEGFQLSGGLYAVFFYKGLSTDTRIFEEIFKTWLPTSDYQLDDRPHFEILGSRYKNGNPDSEEEIWIPVKPRQKQH
ncbi:MAG: GyrI-like domain-containing protein, partial [Flavisolibacter sp.]